MTKIIVLFNLKPGVAVEEYEKWAREKDIPTVRSLISVSHFQVLKMGNLLGTEKASPYQYCELIDVKDMNKFYTELGSDKVQEGAKTFNGFAEAPLFIVSNPI